MSGLKLTNVKKSFGAVEVIRGVDLDIADKEFVVFVGPSGCGKSTLLRLIAGLEDVTQGQIRIGGRDVTQEEPGRRGCAMVFQNYALYPHMTVAGNMAYGLKVAGVPRRERAERVARIAGMLELGALLDRRPHELSGGQRQRDAMGRALVRDQHADEPAPRNRGPRPRGAIREAPGHGQQRPRLHAAARSHQRVLRLARRSLRRQGPSRPFRRGHERAAEEELR